MADPLTGEELNQMIQVLRITQAEIAEACGPGYTRDVVKHWIARNAEIPQEAALALCGFFKQFLKKQDHNRSVILEILSVKFG